MFEDIWFAAKMLAACAFGIAFCYLAARAGAYGYFRTKLEYVMKVRQLKKEGKPRHG